VGQKSVRVSRDDATGQRGDGFIQTNAGQRKIGRQSFFKIDALSTDGRERIIFTCRRQLKK